MNVLKICMANGYVGSSTGRRAGNLGEGAQRNIMSTTTTGFEHACTHVISAFDLAGTAAVGGCCQT